MVAILGGTSSRKLRITRGRGRANVGEQNGSYFFEKVKQQERVVLLDPKLKRRLEVRYN